MEKYNLDDKGGLFKFSAKSPLKIVKQGDEIEIRHFSAFNYVKGSVLNVTDSTISIQVKDKAPELKFSPGDPAALNYRPSNDFYVITSDISSVDKSEPLQITVKVHKIEKMKDLVKEKKFCVSYPASIKIIGVSENKFASVKNVSYGGVKMNCGEDIMLEDFIDVTFSIDKANKISFKGRVVRKNPASSQFEYGLEFSEMTESSTKLLTRCMHDFEAMM